MRTALVLMTILGCDDSATDCQHIATLQQRWTSIELCDAESEKKLGDFVNASYPVIVAVCQTPETPPDQTAKADATTQDPATLSPATEAQVEQTLTQRAISRVRKILPSTEGVKEVLGKPVRMVEDSYSWIAKRLTK
ncbi:hypothetical protein RMR16_006405 [Agrobacterium sp. rho-13.3]|uniref:hypothetical protein n=1 Tax=Agrobacterium sp. rho-13.3 TaxID=3072980 RepID=UPI002A11FDA7|nr:hypothetical protein [Agrobacterium sp. rho-13.3]MDX8311311.1 hypothetical protein [Agrobacterium sp. rho-13.3]